MHNPQGVIPGKLFHPVVDRGEGHNHQERPHDGESLRKVGKEADTLDGLSKTHLIGQDDVVVLHRDCEVAAKMENQAGRGQDRTGAIRTCDHE